MVEWKVLGDEPLPPDEAEDSPARLATRWWLALLLLVIVAVAAGLFALRRQESRLRADVIMAMEQEERALRFGVVQQARELADPNAPAEWLLRYEALFNASPEGASPPQVISVESSRDIALVRLVQDRGENARSSVRAYRLVDNRWRRTPVPADQWGEVGLYQSRHFRLQMSERDAIELPPDKLLNALEKFHTQFTSYWPTREGPVTIRILPNDLATLAAAFPYVSGQQVVLPSPLLASPVAPLSFLNQEQSFRFTLLSAIAQSIDGSSMSERVRAEPAMLWPSLRDGVVRHLVLTEREREQYREWLETNRGDGRLRREVLDFRARVLLADYLVATEGADAPARLLAAYRGMGTLQTASIQLFGRPTNNLNEEAILWQRESASPLDTPLPGTRVTVTVLHVASTDPLRAVVALPGSPNPLFFIPEPDTQLPVPARCLGQRSALSFTLSASSGDSLHGRDIRIESLYPPQGNMASLPRDATTLVARHDGAESEIIALDGAGHETSLVTLTNVSSIMLHPTEPVLYFIQQDECSTTLNQYHLRTGVLTRRGITLHGKGHLFQAAEQLYLLDDRSTSTEATWVINPVEASVIGPTRRFPVARGRAWPGLAGFHLPSGHALVEGMDGDLEWMDLRGRSGLSFISVAPPLPSLPSGAAIVATSPDGRWLAYTLIDRETSDMLLYSYDVDGRRHHLYHRLPAAAAYGAIQWQPGEGTPPILAAVITTRGNQSATQPEERHYVYRFDASNEPYQVARHRGALSNPDWCVIPTRELTTGSQVIGCIAQLPGSGQN